MRRRNAESSSPGALRAFTFLPSTNHPRRAPSWSRSRICAKITLRFERRPLVGESGDSRRPFHVESIELGDFESIPCNDRGDIAIEMTAVGHLLLQRGQPMLPFLNRRLRAQSMFDEEKPPLRLQDATDLLKRLIDIGDAAEGPGADDGVKGAVREGKSLGIEHLVIDFDRRGGDSLLGKGTHPWVGINGG